MWGWFLTTFCVASMDIGKNDFQTFVNCYARVMTGQNRNLIKYDKCQSRCCTGAHQEGAGVACQSCVLPLCWLSSC